MMIEGYAARFLVADASGDRIRPGAFARSIATDTPVPMLLEHRSGKLAGRWHMLREDGNGLYVRGWVDGESPSGAVARERIRSGTLNGLSIGFRARLSRSRSDGPGRDLAVIDLVEVSLVARPMAALARFSTISPTPAARRAG